MLQTVAILIFAREVSEESSRKLLVAKNRQANVAFQKPMTLGGQEFLVHRQVGMERGEDWRKHAPHGFAVRIGWCGMGSWGVQEGDLHS